MLQPGAADSDEWLLDEGLRLTLGHCCHRELSWDCELVERSQAALLAPRLIAQGYTSESQLDWIVQLAHPAGHRVVIVLRTGRVQLRIHYLTPPEERRACALALATQLAQVLAAPPATGSL